MAEKMRKIATAKAWSIPKVAAERQETMRGPATGLDKQLRRENSNADRDDQRYGTLDSLSGLLGVDMHLLSLTAPSVQMFDADTATDLAALASEEGRHKIHHSTAKRIFHIDPL